MVALDSKMSPQFERMSVLSSFMMTCLYRKFATGGFFAPLNAIKRVVPPVLGT